MGSHPPDRGFNFSVTKLSGLNADEARYSMAKTRDDIAFHHAKAWCFHPASPQQLQAELDLAGRGGRARDRAGGAGDSGRREGD